MHIVHVTGARPNFMKAAPVMRALAAKAGVRQTLVHTGQHYDANMSQVFFRQLDIPEPDVNLGVGSGTHAAQTAAVMERFEQEMLTENPDVVLVYGDVNSTLAGALVSAKLHIAVGHVEAGLRSFDRDMPEEINRLLTDHLADLHFTPSLDGNENLLREGVRAEGIHFVGNVMIDTLVHLLPRVPALPLELPEQYAVVTLHRPSNVDHPASLGRIIETLIEISRDLPVVFPMHPRTRQRLEDFELVPAELQDLRLIEPVGYLEFLALQQKAAFVVTDSGGIQEETTYLGVPCLTLRRNTERPITVSMGTNTILGQDMDLLKREVQRILAGKAKKGQIPPLWDGRAGERIAAILLGEGGAG